VPCDNFRVCCETFFPYVTQFWCCYETGQNVSNVFGMTVWHAKRL
jgi:hypothetical protein